MLSRCGRSTRLISATAITPVRVRTSLLGAANNGREAERLTINRRKRRRFFVDGVFLVFLAS